MSELDSSGLFKIMKSIWNFGVQIQEYCSTHLEYFISYQQPCSLVLNFSRSQKSYALSNTFKLLLNILQEQIM